MNQQSSRMEVIFGRPALLDRKKAGRGIASENAEDMAIKFGSSGTMYERKRKSRLGAAGSLVGLDY